MTKGRGWHERELKVDASSLILKSCIDLEPLEIFQSGQNPSIFWVAGVAAVLAANQDQEG